MVEELLRKTQNYLEENEGLAELLELFNMSQEEYERAIQIMNMTAPRPETITSKSDQGEYNVDVLIPTG